MARPARGHALLTMKALNRNQQLALGCPMRGVRAPIVCMLASLALPGCMRTTSPIATTQPQVELDAMAYRQPAYYPAPAQAQAAYAAVPMPVAYDSAYRLDAGDKL